MIGQWRFIKSAKYTNPGIVDPHINTAKIIQSPLSQMLNLLVIGHICSNYQCIAAQLPALLCDLFQQFGAFCCQYHCCTFTGQFQRNALTKTTRRACNYNNFMI